MSKWKKWSQRDEEVLAKIIVEFGYTMQAYRKAASAVGRSESAVQAHLFQQKKRMGKLIEDYDLNVSIIKYDWKTRLLNKIKSLFK